MPSAAPDAALVARFRADLTRLVSTARLDPDPPSLGIALSGGPDSVALLLLAQAAWPGRVRAATVDHGLRAGAATEADAAASLCDTLGIPHETLPVIVPAQASLQAAAREARYAALARWVTPGYPVLLTAHHADDQAETVLMRLARGSGLAGLAGIRAIRVEPDLTILRPLLGWRKIELEAIVAEAGITPARDPSNADPRYDRTRARELLAQADWLDTRRVAAAAAYLAEAEETLDAIAKARFGEAVSVEAGDIIFHPSGRAEIDRRVMRCLMRERFAKSPDGPSLERAFRALQEGETVALADILCTPNGGRWRFRPAPPRNITNRSG